MGRIAAFDRSSIRAFWRKWQSVWIHYFETKSVNFGLISKSCLISFIFTQFQQHLPSSFKFCPSSKIAKFQKLPNSFHFHPITTLAQFLQILPIVKNSQISKRCPITLYVAKFQQKFYFKKCPSLGQICISRFNIINFILTSDQAVAFAFEENSA